MNEANWAQVIALVVLIVQYYIAERNKAQAVKEAGVKAEAAEKEKARLAALVVEEAKENERKKAQLAHEVATEQKLAADRVAAETREAAALVALKAEAVRQALAEGVVVATAKLDGIAHQTDTVHGLVNSAAEKARLETEAGRKENRKLAAMVTALRREISDMKLAEAKVAPVRSAKLGGRTERRRGR